MLFMVIERFKQRDATPIGERFRQKGRMMPEGVSYIASWMDAENARCFQLMEAPTVEDMDPWLRAWDDLVDFEVVPVETSAEFWAKRASKLTDHTL
jgi:Protein of unknown function (DUF3303)